MSILCLILFLTALALWFFTNESSSVFGIYEPTCVIRRVRFKWLVFIGLLASLPFCGDVSDSVAEAFAFGGFDDKSALLILLLSLVVLMIMRFFGVGGSLVYAVLGSLMAFGVISEKAYSVDPAFILSFIVAPVAAFLLSAYTFYRWKQPLPSRKTLFRNGILAILYGLPAYYLSGILFSHLCHVVRIQLW